MALFHFTVDQVKRSEGQSAIASAAYRSGERLYSEYYGEYSDYTRKGGVICSDILLPSHAPPEFADRQTLWNAVEQVERGKKAQLAYSFEIALQNEFTIEENIALARQFLFILKLGLKILAAPVVLALALFTWVCFGLLYVSSFVFGLASTVVALLGIAVLVTYSPQNGIILLVIAFLVSPVGLPMAAAWLVGKVQDLRYVIQDAVYG